MYLFRFTVQKFEDQKNTCFFFRCIRDEKKNSISNLEMFSTWPSCQNFLRYLQLTKLLLIIAIYFIGEEKDLSSEKLNKHTKWLQLQNVSIVYNEMQTCCYNITTNFRKVKQHSFDMFRASWKKTKEIKYQQSREKKLWNL